ncbi:hypothetical protein [Owenweeksia hongkongensis]|uniref:hypothetical protein n=1 Tax=Owenweeksia hongkongensis TaxID=253245 RepID=UPI003A8F836D
MAYFRPLFIGIDQLINTIAGGDPDNTISSRIGYYAEHGPENQKKMWKAFAWITDKTFWPLEGDDHCHIAYHADPGENFDADKNGVGVVVLFILTLPFLILIGVLLYLGWAVGLVKQIQLDRSEAIRQRLFKTSKMLISIKEELVENPLADPALLKSLDSVVERAAEAREEIEKCIMINPETSK